MKKLLLTINSILLTLVVFSQERGEEGSNIGVNEMMLYDAKKGYIGISIGPSYAISDAALGLNINYLDFYYKFNNNIGMAISLYGIANNENSEEIRKRMLEDLVTNLDLYVFNKNEKASMGVGTGMLGILITFPYDNLELDMKVLIGSCTAIIPESEVTLLDEFSSTTYRHEELESNATSYNLGCGLRHHLSEKWALNLNLNYFITQVKFPKYIISSSDDTNFASDSFEKRISYINSSIGIGYRIK